MRSAQVIKWGVALLAAFSLAAGAVAWLTAPSPWWVNPDFSALDKQLRACESRFAMRQPCEVARVMARQALDALRACLGDQAEVDGCAGVRHIAAGQDDSLQKLVLGTPAEPATRVWLVFGFTTNPWLRAARAPFLDDRQLGGARPWVLMAFVCCGLVGFRVAFLRIAWQGQEGRSRALRSDLDELEQAERQLGRQLNWLDALQSRLNALQRARHASLLLAADAGAPRGHTEAKDLRIRFDQAFGPQPPSATSPSISAAMADDGTWRELGSFTRNASASGTRRLLHLPTGLLLRVACHHDDSPHGDGGFWEFAVQLDAVEAELSLPRPAELRADFLRWDWLSRVSHDVIATDDWSAALAAGQDWLEGVLRREAEVEGGTLSTHVECHLRAQFVVVRRTKARKAAQLRALREELGMGWSCWCWQGLLHRKPSVPDVAFQVYERSL